jgi:Putative transposase
VLGRLFRRLFLRELENAFNAGKLRFFTNLANLAEPQAFARRLRELRRLDWVVYAKPPFGGPEQVLAYLGRYTHRVAIANSRLLSLADGKVRFTWKDYRADGMTKVMTLDADEFIRRFLLQLCRRASIASATTVSSPMAPAMTASLSVVGCSKPVPRVPSTSLRTIAPKAIARSPLLPSPSVLSAVAPCGGSQSCHAPATLTRTAAAARTRTQRPGKHLAVHASQLVVKPDFQILRRYRRPLLLRLEHTHRPTLEDYVHRATRLGSSRSLNLRIGITSPPMTGSNRG